jgi:hypothetical protein
MRLPRGRTLLLTVVVGALAAVSLGALQRELTPKAAVAPMVFWQGKPLQKPLTADEEFYAEALWPIHSELVETSAVAMSFAGISYVTEDHDGQKLAASARALRDKFAAASEKMKTLETPPSMQGIRQQYAAAVALFERAAGEMVQTGEDGKVEHLVDAQAMSQRAAEDLLKVGDVLWPGEHKPN